jgi:hypothetical protein
MGSLTRLWCHSFVLLSLHNSRRGFSFSTRRIAVDMSCFVVPSVWLLGRLGYPPSAMTLNPRSLLTRTWSSCVHHAESMSTTTRQQAQLELQASYHRPSVGRPGHTIASTRHLGSVPKHDPQKFINSDLLMKLALKETRMPPEPDLYP